MKVRYSDYYLRARKENLFSEQYQKEGEALEIGTYLVKVKWTNGSVELVPRGDLDGLPPLEFSSFNILSLHEMATDGIHLKPIEKWEKINGEWVMQEIKEIQYRKAITDKDKYLLSKAPDSYKKKHDLRGLTEFEWKMISR